MSLLESDINQKATVLRLTSQIWFTMTRMFETVHCVSVNRTRALLGVTLLQNQ